MKLSTTMLVIAVLLFFGVLTAYNFSLKAAYDKGVFRDRFGEHTFRQIDNIKQIQLKAANMVSLSIEHGEREGVWVSNHVKDLVRVNQTGEVVIVDLNYSDPKKFRHMGPTDVVMIVNKLNKVSSDNYQVNGKELENYGGALNISGLTGDSFTLLMADQAVVYLDRSRFKLLNAIVGGDKYWSRLTVAGNNRIDTAYFDIRKGSLELQNPEILVPHYKVGDSSRIELWGRLAKRIGN